MKKIRSINKLLLIFILTSLTFLSVFMLLGRTYKAIKNTSDEISSYNDTILTIKDDFSRYLLHDSNIDHYNFQKEEYLVLTNSKLNKLNKHTNGKITDLIKEKDSLVNAFNIKTYEIKVTNAVVNYTTIKGSFIFKKEVHKKKYYKKIEDSEIVKFNKVEKRNNIKVRQFIEESDRINRDINYMINLKIKEIENSKIRKIEKNLNSSRNNFYYLSSIVLILVSLITWLTFCLFNDIRTMKKKNELDKVTLSFLIEFIKNNR